MDMFIGNPEESVRYDLETRGKLVIHLVNGKYVTFSKGEFNGGYLVLNGEWSRSISREPFRTRIYEACGSYSPLVVTKVLDRSGGVTGLGPLCFGDFRNMVSVSLPECLTLYSWCFYNCRSLVTDIWLPKARTVLPNAGDSNGIFMQCVNLSVLRLPSMTRLAQAYESFQGCTSLRTLDFPNMDIISNNNINFLNNATSVEELSFPKLKSIQNYTERYCFSLGNTSVRRILFPRLQSVTRSPKSEFAGATKCTYAEFGKMTMQGVRNLNSFGLPSGCLIRCLDGSYAV